MKNLNIIPDQNNADGSPNHYFNFYTNIVRDKYNPAKNALQTIAPTVLEKYIEYVQVFNNNTFNTLNAHPFSRQHKTYLQDCYGATASYDALRKKIFDLQSRELNQFCQYCGIGQPSSIDHYLPQTPFPEYSVLAINLIDLLR